MQPGRFISISAPLLLIAGAATAQTGTPTVLYTLDGSHPGERLGWTVAGPGDLNGDGVPEFLAGGPGDFISGSFPGIVRAYSGLDGSALYTVSGLTNSDGFGMALAVLEDLDGDGAQDFAVGAPYDDFNGIDSGTAYVYSGATGALLGTSHGSAPGEAYGWSLTTGNDFNSDLLPDLVVGAPLFDGVAPDCGRILVIDPISSGVISAIEGTLAFEEQGYTVTSARKGINVSIFASAPGHQSQVGTPGVFIEWRDNSSMVLIIDVAYIQGGNQRSAGLNCAAFTTPSSPFPAFACETWVISAPVEFTYVILFQRSPASQMQVEHCNAYVQWYPHTACVAVAEDSTGLEGLLIGNTSTIGILGTEFALRSQSDCGTTQQRFDKPAGLTRCWSIAGAGTINSDSIRDFMAGDPFAPAAGLDSGRVAVFLNQGPNLPPLIYCTPKTNSLGCVPVLDFEGAPSLSVADNFRIKATNVLNNKPGVFLWAINATSIPFGGGTLCVGPLVHRVPFSTSGGNPPPNDCSGSYQFHCSQAFLAGQGITPGVTLYAQYYSRDQAFPAPGNIGLTKAIRFTVHF